MIYQSHIESIITLIELGGIQGNHDIVKCLRSAIKHSTPPKNKELSDRITEYLTKGGLCNPELMEHNKVRDLLIEIREYLDMK